MLTKWCTRPGDSTGYVITGLEGRVQVLMTDVLPQYFKNVGVHHSCATGYSATPTVTSCAEPGLPYIHPLSLHNNYNDHNDQLQPSDMWLSMLEECDSAQPNLPSKLLVSS